MTADSNISYKADYLGGEPRTPAGIKGGRLTVRDGGLLFSCRVSGGNPMSVGKVQTQMAFGAEQLAAVSYESVLNLSRLGNSGIGGLWGVALGGSLQGAAWGALLGSVFSARSKKVLAVAVAAPDARFVATFMINEKDTNALHGALLAQRAERGLGEPLPTVKELVSNERGSRVRDTTARIAGSGASGVQGAVEGGLGKLAGAMRALQATGGADPSPDEGSDVVVGEVVDDPSTRLRKLGELREAGLITDDEYEVKRTEVLADL